MTMRPWVMVGWSSWVKLALSVAEIGPGKKGFEKMLPVF